MLKHLSGILLMALMIALPGLSSAADPEPNINALQKMAEEIQLRDTARQTPQFLELLNSSDPAAVALSQNPNLQLMYIGEDGHPVYYKLDNIDAARTINVETLWSFPSNLTGSGLTLGQLCVWDGGAVRTTHREFEGRAVQIDSPPAISDHATHVSGTMIAAGIDPDAIGMANDAPLAAYDWNSDVYEMTGAGSAGARVSNHSYGFAHGWDFNTSNSSWYWYGNISVSAVEDYRFGLYSSDTRQWDLLAYNAPGYLIFKSAGNDRGDGPAAGTGHYVYDGGWIWSTDTRDLDGGQGGYDCISTKGTAKNIMTIGSCLDLPTGYSQPSNVVLNTFSAYGPTDDGRIKPDLVANGNGLFSSVGSSDFAYASYSGTSMSSPNAAGGAALVVERYHEKFGSYPLASTTKALLINTTDEAGTADGPDYRFGWGLMNTGRAVENIDAGIIFEGSLSNGAIDEYELIPSDGYPLSVTLAWTDPAGNSLSSLNPTTPSLVNDLDVRVTQDATTYMPWVLDPADPSTAATTGDNFRDNVERINVATTSSGTITVQVTHKGYLSSSQTYSLVVNGASDTTPSWTNVADAALAGTANSTGLAWVDYDTDGDLDLYVTNLDAENKLFRNDAGTFTDVTTAPLNIGSGSWASVWADYDSDGDPDVYTTRDNLTNILLRNDGGVFTDVTFAGLNDNGPSRGASWVDFNSDGMLDLYIVNYNTANKLMKLAVVFDQVYIYTQESGLIANALAGQCAVWSDYDNDSDQDVYLTNRAAANMLLQNLGDYGFDNSSVGNMASNSFSAGAAWGDYNNDGLMDLYFTNYTGTDYLYKNTGTTFLDITGGPLHDSGNGRGVSWGDYDNDGDLDLYVARYGQPDLLMTNEGGDVFSLVTQGFPNTGGNNNSAVWADYDGDGDLDIYIAAEGQNMLIRNDIANDNHWLQIQPIGVMSNASAIGARVRIVSGGVAQIREITAGSGYMSQEAMRASFGLGASTLVDTLTVYWPSGTVQDTTNVAVDQMIYFVERDPLSTVGENPEIPGNTLAALKLYPCYPNPFNPITTVSFDLPEPAEVSVVIHDARGRRVNSLFSGYKGAGRHSLVWKGQGDNGRSLSSGIYFVTLMTEEHRLTQRVVLTK